MYHIQLVKVGRLLQAITIMRPIASIHERRKTCAVPYSIQVLNHLGNGELAESAPGGANGVQYRGIGLEGVEVLDRVAIIPGGHGPAGEGGNRYIQRETVRWKRRQGEHQECMVL